MITIKRNMKKYNEFEFKGTFTLGKILAIQKALELYAPQSPVAYDVFQELNYEWKEKQLDSVKL